MLQAICIVYRHQYGCAWGDCPNHIAMIRNRKDADRAIRALTSGHPARPVEIVRISHL